MEKSVCQRDTAGVRRCETKKETEGEEKEERRRGWLSCRGGGGRARQSSLDNTGNGVAGKKVEEEEEEEKEERGDDAGASTAARKRVDKLPGGKEEEEESLLKPRIGSVGSLVFGRKEKERYDGKSVSRSWEWDLVFCVLVLLLRRRLRHLIVRRLSQSLSVSLLLG